MRKNKNRRFQYANQHAAIRVEPNFEANVGGTSFTANREDDFGAEIMTDSSNTSSLVVSSGQATVALTGRQARTLQRLLNKHYASCNLSADPTPGGPTTY